MWWKIKYIYIMDGKYTKNQLAAAGFIYSEIRDDTKCSFCQVEVWNSYEGYNAVCDRLNGSRDYKFFVLHVTWFIVRKNFALRKVKVLIWSFYFVKKLCNSSTREEEAENIT